MRICAAPRAADLVSTQPPRPPRRAGEQVRIAAAAVEHLPSQGTVLIGTGSAAGHLVDLFPTDRELTVYTSTLTTALALSNRPLLTVFCLGGRVRPASGTAVDDWTARALAEINVDVAILGAEGISVGRGLTTLDPAEAAVKRRMLGCARRRIVLADPGSIGVVRRIRFGDLDDVDLLITGAGLGAGQLDELRSAGMTVEQA